MSGGQDNSSDYTREIHKIHHEKVLELLPLIILMSILCVVGIIGNIVTILFYSKKQRRTQTIFLIKALAVVDLIVCILFIPNIAEMVVNILHTSALACKCMHFLGHWFVESSSLILGFIAFDRYWKICGAFGRTMKHNTAKIAVVCIIVFSCLMSVRDFVNFELVRTNLTNGNSSVEVIGHFCSNSKNPDLKWSVLIFHGIDAFTFLVILIIIILAYSKVLWTLSKLSRQMTPQRSPDRGRNRRKKSMYVRHKCSDPDSNNVIVIVTECADDVGKETDVTDSADDVRKDIDVTDKAGDVRKEIDITDSDDDIRKETDVKDSGDDVLKKKGVMDSADDVRKETNVKDSGDDVRKKKYVTDSADDVRKETDVMYRVDGLRKVTDVVEYADDAHKDNTNADQNENSFNLLTVQSVQYKSSMASLDSNNQKTVKNGTWQMKTILKQNNKQRSEWNVTMLMFVVSISFIVCFIPYCVARIGLQLLQKDESVSELGFLFQTALRFSYINSVLNPLIYTLFNPSFRRHAKRILMCEKGALRALVTQTGMTSE